MPDTFAVAEAAIRHSLATLDRVSNNVANAATPGFKRELRVQPTFDSQLRGEQIARSGAARDWSPGALKFTGTPLDFAIEGEGWFQLQSPHGVVLTRNASLQIGSDGRLVSSHGWPVVLDTDAAPPPGQLTLRANDELWVDDFRVGRFQLVSASPDTLHPAGAGVYKSEAVTPEAATASVRQGYLEASNVNSLHEMVDLIDAVRQAEAAQRMMRAYDEAIETALTTLGEF